MVRERARTPARGSHLATRPAARLPSSRLRRTPAERVTMPRSKGPPLGVVIRNVHPRTTTDAIELALRRLSFDVRRVTRARDAVTRYTLSMVFVEIGRDRRSDAIFDLQWLQGSRVRVEPNYRTEHRVQCENCQNYGHAARYCGYRPRCVSCGGMHRVSECEKPRWAPPKCALCGGPHPANYKGCFVYRKMIYERKKTTKVNIMPIREEMVVFEPSLGEIMNEFKTNEIAESDSDELFQKCLYRRSYPPQREQYLKENWIFIRNHLAGYNLQFRIKFETCKIGLTVIRDTKNEILLSRARQLLKLMTFNIPYHYSVRILQNNIFVAYIDKGYYFTDESQYYIRRHRLLEPDMRTLTYIEFFTNCNVWLNRKMIILLGVYKGVKEASRIVLDTLEGQYHPIERLRTLMSRHVLSKKKPEIDYHDWNNFLYTFPPSMRQNRKQVDIVLPSIKPKIVGRSHRTGYTKHK